MRKDLGAPHASLALGAGPCTEAGFGAPHASPAVYGALQEGRARPSRQGR